MILLFQSGHFPWLFSLMKAAFSHTEAGKAIAYIRKIALGLVKSRRENGHEEKVYIYRSY